MDIKDKQRTLFKRLKRLRINATEAESHFKSLLDKTDTKYIFQKGFIAGNNYTIVDFYLPKPNKICIEIDGGYHTTEEQFRKDCCNTAYLRKTRGFRVVRLTNEEVMSMTKFDVNEIP